MNNKSSVLITGGTRGIGLATAKLFSDYGRDVWITGREKNFRLNEFPDNIHYIQMNIGNEEQVISKFKYFDNIEVNIDTLVNNAGINLDGLIVNMSMKSFNECLNVNLSGTFSVIREAFKRMKKRKRGSIINVSSYVGIHGNIGQINYSASKAGLIGITKSVAKEGKNIGIRSNAVAPGMIDTSMVSALSDRRRKEFYNIIPLKRFGTREEIASTILFIDSNEYITGQVINVDGGLSI